MGRAGPAEGLSTLGPRDLISDPLTNLLDTITWGTTILWLC